MVCQAEMINACKKKNSGNLRLVDNPGQCLRSELPVSWNNVPQSDLVALQDRLNELNDKLSSLENGKVKRVMERVNYIETEKIVAVTDEISDIQVVHAKTRKLVDSNEYLLESVKTDVQATSGRVDTLDEALVSTTTDLASTTADLASTAVQVEEVNGLILATGSRIATLEDTAVSIVADFEEATSEVTDEVADLANNLGALQEVLVIEELQDVDAVNKLISLAPYITVNTEMVNGVLIPEIIFEGANVHIRSGSGATDDDGEVLGLGNLIIGYNEGRENMEDEETIRTGSHNLVIGPYHNYESVGGFVAGSYNTVSGAYATVSGGEGNTAVGYAAAVSGESYNTAAQDYDLMPMP